MRGGGRGVAALHGRRQNAVPARGHRQRHGRVAPVGAGSGVVVLLEPVEEALVPVHATVHAGALATLDDRLDVFAVQRLVGLQRVRDRQHRGAVLPQDRLGPVEQFTQLVLDPVGQRRAQLGLGALTFWGPPRPPPGLPTSSRRAVEYDDTVWPMPQ